MNEIIHTGTVIAVDKDKVTLKLYSASCDNCTLRSACGSAANSEHGFSIETPEAGKFSLGQKVEVVLSSMQAAGAAFWGYIAPLILVLTVLFAVLSCGGETLAAILSLGVLPVYYFLLWLYRDKLKKTLQIKIR